MKEQSKILIANTGEDSLTIIDVKEKYRKKTIPFLSFVTKNKDFNSNGLFIGPYELSKSNEKNKIYSVNSYNNTIFKINYIEKEIEDVVIVGSFPTCIKSYNDCIFICNSDSNSISVIDEKKFELIQIFSVGEKPYDIQIDYLTKKLFVANSNGYSIDVINLNNNTQQKIKLNKNPVRLFLEKRLMYVLCYTNNGTLNSSNIYIIHLDNFDIIKNIKLNGIFNNMLKIKDKNFIFLTNLEDGYLYKINIVSNNIVNKIYLGGMPNKLISHKDQLLFITNILNNTLTVFDLKCNKILKNIKVGLEPNGLIFI